MAKKCENCGNEHIEVVSKEIGYVCGQCGRNTVKMEEMQPKTNADRIRAMSDEELAEFINTVSNDSIDTITAYGTKSHTEVWEDKESTMQWLQSEAE